MVQAIFVTRRIQPSCLNERIRHIDVSPGQLVPVGVDELCFQLRNRCEGEVVLINGRVFDPDRCRKNRERNCFEDVESSG